LATGSLRFAKTIGIVRVSRWIATVAGVDCARMMSGCSPTNSCASVRIRDTRSNSCLLAGGRRRREERASDSRHSDKGVTRGWQTGPTGHGQVQNRHPQYSPSWPDRDFVPQQRRALPCDEPIVSFNAAWLVIRSVRLIALPGELLLTVHGRVHTVGSSIATSYSRVFGPVRVQRSVRCKSRVPPDNRSSG
jgi:hypothetical protein